jgi:hypothetical protein
LWVLFWLRSQDIEEMKHSQGVLNGKITKLNGTKEAFDELVKDWPRENQVKGWRHYVTVNSFRDKK